MGWWWVVLAVALGVAAALVLRPRRYRYADDEVRRDVSPWWVPVAAGLGAVLAGPFWSAEPLPLVLTGVLALVWLAVLTVIDLEVHRLPDVLTLPAYPVVALLLTWAAAATGRWDALAVAAACSGGAVVVFALLVIFSPGRGGLGEGDVKLAGVLGALLGWFSWRTAAYGLVAGFLVGGLVAVVLLVARRASRRTAIAFGPAMVAGAYLVGTLAPVVTG
ncbi:prepilin peptidase [Microlunatus flavus]|uniref:Leader peptidase (Prepilin peptidase) / N-methyltransferase n=1 Tax=Microlunatus flavus TaxID=1036181 RepID=A0A1H9A0Y8_9ACTN|nr:A24 family peptidase [Microlunatus flavus]SEP70304.1 leader peptidase (prepilin peptidase) / N-methyltransferase [Microlunatus flavus]